MQRFDTGMVGMVIVQLRSNELVICMLEGIAVLLATHPCFHFLVSKKHPRSTRMIHSKIRHWHVRMVPCLAWQYVAICFMIILLHCSNEANGLLVPGELPSCRIRVLPNYAKSGSCRLPVGLTRVPSGRRFLRDTVLKGWYPKTVTYDDDIFAEDLITEELEDRVVSITSGLIRSRLKYLAKELTEEEAMETVPSNSLTESAKTQISALVTGRFMDLTCKQSGEHELECLFLGDDRAIAGVSASAKDAALASNVKSADIISAIVMVIQSLCVMGSQVGVKGQPEQLRRMVEHLADGKNGDMTNISAEWNNDSVRRLKYRLDRAPALQLLASLQWKQTPQGAFDLLVALRAWEKHEDLALLRSGFPIRFTVKEEEAAIRAVATTNDRNDMTDPDTILGIRKDLRHLKVYTIDSASTAEIDDGISTEKILDINNQTKYRIWVHIADAERWAPPGSDLFEVARRRITSLYLPHGSISMFPTAVGTELMSLKSQQDVFALSLAVNLNEDGSIDDTSLLLTPSTIRVSYRLTYDEVDEMLDEGVGYSEEWELGALLQQAKIRRMYRIQNGSTEGVIPTPIPYGSVSIFPDEEAKDSIGISLNLEVSHNAASNKSATAESDLDNSMMSTLELPLSSANLLVTESMILAGEALARWKGLKDAEEIASRQSTNVENVLRLPFRTQRQPGKSIFDKI